MTIETTLDLGQSVWTMDFNQARCANVTLINVEASAGFSLNISYCAEDDLSEKVYRFPQASVDNGFFTSKAKLLASL